MVVKKIISTVILFFVAFVMPAQEDFISLEISPKRVEVGEPVAVIIKTNVEGEVNIDLPDEFEQSGASHSGMSSSVSYIGGKRSVERYSFQKFTGFFTEEGTFSMGPAKIKENNKEFASKIQQVKVAKVENMISANPSKNMNQAIFGIINQSKEEVFVGEPLIVEAKVFAQIDVMQVENFKPSAVQGGAESINLDKAKRIKQDIEVVDDQQIYTFRMGKTLIFPEEEGQFELSPFELGVYYSDPRSLFPERTKVRSNNSKITVKPLPSGSPEGFDGAVGEFSVEMFFNQNKIKQGKVLPVYVRVKGAGNLHHVSPLKLDLPSGVVLYGDPEVNDSTFYSNRGVEGYREFIYYLQVEQAGELNIPSLKFAYFDPVATSYKESRTRPVTLHVLPDENHTIVDVLKQEHHTEGNVNKGKGMSSFMAERNTVNQDLNLYSGVKGWLVGTPILLAFIFVWGVRFQEKIKPKQQAKFQMNKAYQEVIDKINHAQRKSLSSSAFYKAIETPFLTFLSLKLDLPVQRIRTYLLATEEQNFLSDEQKISLEKFFTYGDTIHYSGGLDEEINQKELASELISIVNSLKEDSA